MLVALLAAAVAQSVDESLVLKGPGLRAREDGLRAAVEGRFSDALPLLKRAAGNNPPTRSAAERQAAAHTENALGGTLKALGRAAEAASAFERAYALLHDRDSAGTDLAVVINNLGAARADAGRVAEAEALYSRALRLSSDRISGGDGEYDDDDDETSAARVHRAEVLNNLADLRHGAGRLEEARSLHAGALSVRERVHGPRHISIAGSLNNVAVLLMDMRRHDEALPMLRRAAAITKGAAGQRHPQHATALSNLAGALMQLNRASEAREPLKRALAINKAALGASHESTKAAAKDLRTCEAVALAEESRA